MPVTHGVQSLEKPPYSPDLNPIENLWEDLKRRVSLRNASSVDELEQHVREEWAATDQSLLARLAHSMPARCQAVIANKGHRKELLSYLSAFSRLSSKEGTSVQTWP